MPDVKILPIVEDANGISTAASNTSSTFSKTRYMDKVDTTILRGLSQDKEMFDAFGGIKGLLKALLVNPTQGVGSGAEGVPLENPEEDSQERQHVFGTNTVPEKAATTYMELVREALSDATLVMLLTAAVVVLGMWTIFERHGLGWVEGISILGTVMFVVNLQAFQDWKKEKEFRKLNQELNDIDVNVIRYGGKMTTVSKSDVVVGDIIRLRIGDILIADGCLLEGEDISMDESGLTGESEGVVKNAGDFLMSDTSVQNGQGLYVVTAVGVHTEAGNIRALIRGVDVASMSSVGSAESMASTATASTDATDVSGGSKSVAEKEKAAEGKRTVLQRKLDVIAQKIGKVAMAVSAVATIVMIARYFLTQPEEDGLKQSVDEVLAYFMTGVTIVVVAVPEGLPLAVTLALALSVRKMQRDHNLVKTLDSAETMGSATTICSDKTGTLTQNRMTAVQFFAGGKYASKGIQSASHATQAEETNDCAGDTEGYDKLEQIEARNAKGGFFRLFTRSSSDLQAAKVKFQAGGQGNSRTMTNELSEILQSSGFDTDFIDAVVDNICFNRADAEISWNRAAGRWSHSGNITDCALLAMAHEWGYDYKTRPAKKVAKRFPFSSTRKMGSCVMDLSQGQRVYVKGACEMVLDQCASGFGNGGKLNVNAMKEIMKKMAGQGLRCIALAHKDLAGPVDFDANDAQNAMESSLTLDCIVGIRDPLRPSVPPAIRACTKAGIDVRMVTGDNPDTAVHISRQAGILRDGVDFIRGEKETQQLISPDGEEVIDMVDRDAFKHVGPCGLLYRSPHVVMTGPEFRKFVLDKNEQIIQENLDQVWPYLRVLARSSPTDKYTLVSGMKKSELYTNSYFVEETGIYPDGQVIAVTGDGSNDAPALAKADVGFAMGITGTAVAKDAADIILLDDDFASIVQACLWGRNIHDCISKFLQFQLTVNIAAVCIACLGAFRNSESPLRTTQLLWVNLIMDSLGALALAAEPPTDSLLNRAPYGRHKSLVTTSMWVKMLGQAAYQMVVLVLLLFYGAGPVIPEEMYDVLDHPMYRCNSTQFCLDYPEHCGEGLIEEYSFKFGMEGVSVPVPNGSGRAGTKHMPSEHYTIMFHAFVWMTLFNWINCRKLHLTELNPFQGILSNPVFCIIWILCAAMQWGLVEIGAQNDKWDACHNLPARTKGLTFDQHLFCMAIGVGSIPLQVVISYIARHFVADEK